MENVKINLSFSTNLNYILLNLKKAIEEANSLENQTYLELSKAQIIEYLNDIYLKLLPWQDNYNTQNYEIIIKNYKEIEVTISQLELCLADYDSIFHIEGISYSLFQIGKILSIYNK